MKLRSIVFSLNCTTKTNSALKQKQRTRGHAIFQATEAFVPHEKDAFFKLMNVRLQTWKLLSFRGATCQVQHTTQGYTPISNYVLICMSVNILKYSRGKECVMLSKKLPASKTLIKISLLCTRCVVLFTWLLWLFSRGNLTNGHHTKQQCSFFKMPIIQALKKKKKKKSILHSKLNLSASSQA